MKSLLFGLAVAASAVLSSPVLGQAQYPSKPVRLIVPYPPGGGTDTMARTLGLKLSEMLGQQVIVDNRPGGGANIGAELAAKSPPDGYTLLMCTIAHATADLGGEVALAFATTPSVINHVKAGRLRAVAVTTARRSVATPELPTISELGLAGYDVGSWYGLLAPAGTQKDIVARINAESHKALRLPDVKQRMDASGFDALTSTPEEYGAFLRGEVDKWAKVVKAAGIRAD